MPKFRQGKRTKGKIGGRVLLRAQKAESTEKVENAPDPEVESISASEVESTPDAEVEPTVPGMHPETSTQEHDELGRLRGIIFGTLQHDQQQLLTRLENRMAAQAAKIRGELEVLAGRLENRIAEHGVRSTRDEADLRERIESQRDLLSEAIDERGAQVTELVNKDLLELRKSKIDRECFSAFLLGLSRHLDGGDDPADPATAPESESKLTRPKSGLLGLGRPPWHPARSS